MSDIVEISDLPEDIQQLIEEADTASPEELLKFAHVCINNHMQAGVAFFVTDLKEGMQKAANIGNARILSDTALLIGPLRLGHDEKTSANLKKYKQGLINAFALHEKAYAMRDIQGGMLMVSSIFEHGIMRPIDGLEILQEALLQAYQPLEMSTLYAMLAVKYKLLHPIDAAKILEDKITKFCEVLEEACKLSQRLIQNMPSLLEELPSGKSQKIKYKWRLVTDPELIKEARTELGISETKEDIFAFPMWAYENQESPREDIKSQAEITDELRWGKSLAEIPMSSSSLFTALSAINPNSEDDTCYVTSRSTLLELGAKLKGNEAHFPQSVLEYS